MLSDNEAWLLRKLQISERIGIPPGAAWAEVVIPATTEPLVEAAIMLEGRFSGPSAPFERPDGPPCRFEMLGIIVECVPENRQRIYMGSPTGHAIEVWLAAAKLPNGRAGAEVAWCKDHRESRLMLEHGVWTNSDLQDIGKAVKWLEAIPRIGGYKATSDQDAFEAAVKLGLEWQQANPHDPATGFTLKQFSAARCTGPDATKKWLKDKHFGMREVQREISRRFRGPG